MPAASRSDGSPSGFPQKSPKPPDHKTDSISMHVTVYLICALVTALMAA